METEQELNAKILKITMVIRDNYPELHQYLNEMPITIPVDQNPEINVQHLKKYYDSLVAIFRNYVAEHQLNYINQRNIEGHL
ncbi:hypothetical protein [Flavobacterium sp.]|uniref:hypothetical protein n=1 Tax=Flavobacterium sp. TaxID=239 RepID=UPI0026356C15|nr:hypothetical protein [Flavobacterium sp.]